MSSSKLPAPHHGVGKGPGWCQKLEAPPCPPELPFLLCSPELGTGPPYVFCAVQSSFVYLMPWGWMRGGESGYVLPLPLLPRVSPNLAWEPELLRLPRTPQGLSPAPHPHLLPYVPQAPIHPQCNKMVCSVRLLPLLCGPGEGQNCWGEM